MTIQQNFGDFDFFSGWLTSVSTRSAQDAAARQARERQRIADEVSQDPPRRPKTAAYRSVDFFDSLGDILGGSGTTPVDGPQPAPPFVAPAPSLPNHENGQDAPAADLVEAEPMANPEVRAQTDAVEDLNDLASDDPSVSPGLGAFASPDADSAAFDVLSMPRDANQWPEREALPFAAEPERVDIDSLDDDVAERLQAGRDALEASAGEAVVGAYIPVADFRLSQDILAEDRSPREKALDNIRAIEITKSVMMSGRPATEAEKIALARYVGWGGLQYAFYDIEGKTKKGWEEIARQLHAVLSPDEYARARATMLDAHYTSGDVVSAMWSGVRRMGYVGGDVMEPAGGVGNFLGLQPADLAEASRRTLVEIDPTTATIAKILYPKSRVINAPFERVSTGQREFDLFIGNPPFGDTRINDRRGDGDPTRTRLSTHDATNTHSYFFARAAEGLRPGGIAAFVVSRYLLDGSTLPATEFRRSLARSMDLIDAVRLPDVAFSQNAGTEVVTDVIFLQKRAEPRSDEEIDALPWIVSQDTKNPDEQSAELYPTIRMNQWYVQHPEKVLGRLHAGRGMYRDGELKVAGIPDWKDRFEAAMQALPEGIMPAPRAQTASTHNNPFADVRIPPDVRPGQMFVADDAQGNPAIFRRAPVDDVAYPVKTANQIDQSRLIAMLGMASQLRRLIAMQLDPDAQDHDIEQVRAALSANYDAFVKEHGFLNRPTNKRLIREDEAWILLSGLEVNYNPGLSRAAAKKTGATPREPSAERAAILSQRTQWPITPATSAGSAKDALAISLAETGGVNVARMMALTGKPWDDLRAELGNLIYFDPVDAIWREASDMLSGDVVTKIENTTKVLRTYVASGDPDVAEIDSDKARIAAEIRRTLDALESVRPARKTFSEITPLPGAAWVPMDVLTEFFKTVAGPSTSATYTPSSGKWEFSGHGGGAPEFSTQQMSAREILSALWNGRPIVVRDRLPDGGSVINHEQTALARQKSDAIVQRWFDFLAETPERMALIEDRWNAVFNRMVPRVYSGDHLTLEGSSSAIQLRPHQKNAVWRALQSPCTLFDHVVGAGKTFASVAVVMEARRMGRSKKALVVAPEKVIGQWRDAFAQLYPGARVLMAEPEDMAAGKRQQFLAKAAYGDWDAVIMAHSSFGLIPCDPDFEVKYTEDLIELARSDLLANKSNQASRKDIEKKIKKLRARIERISSTRKDVGMHFGMMGFDLLIVDESHKFKNVTYETQLKVSGLGNPEGSARANDMMMKVNHLREMNGKVVFATGTPIANTLAEMYILHRYMAPHLLVAQGLYSFDSWQRAYAQVTSEFTFTLSGQFKEKTTLAKFVNLTGLLGTYRTFADTITREDMNRLMENAGQERIRIPRVRGDKPFVHVCPMSPEQRSIMGEQIGIDEDTGHPIYPEGSILWRLDHLPKGPPQKGDDNILTIINHLRLVGLDARAFDPSMPAPKQGKIPTCAKAILESYKTYDADKGTQLVFLDLCTPKKGQDARSRQILDLIAASESDDADVAEAADEALEAIPKAEIDAAVRGSSGFDAYRALKEDLVNLGIPSEQIAFIHDYDTPVKFDRLTAAMNAGSIRVLIGSTAKIGAGVNVQKRITDIHMLTAPYTPAEIEQSIGRGLRQGNMLLDKYGDEHFQIGIHYYVTEDSGDAGLWQILQTKLEFIEQIRSGNAGNEMENPDAAAIDPGRVKAMASGNEILMEEVKLRDQIQKAERLLRAAQQDRVASMQAVEQAKSAVQACRDRLEPARKLQDAALAAVRDVQAATEALRKQIEEHKAKGEKHAAADVIDVLSKVPVYRLTQLDGKTITTNLADIGARIVLVASRAVGNGRALKSVGEINGVPVSVRATYDFSSAPAPLMGTIYAGTGNAAVASRSINFSLRDVEGAVGRALWKLIENEATRAGDEAKADLEAAERELERRNAYLEQKKESPVSMDDLNTMRERLNKAVLALRLGCRKWDQFETKLAESQGRQAAKEQKHADPGIDAVEISATDPVDQDEARLLA